MTEHKTLNTVIHAAFRRDLLRFDNAFRDFPTGSSERAEALGRAWDNFADQLHQHHDHEETIFWPAMAELGVDPTLMADLDGEHDRMNQALGSASESMATFRAQPTPENVQSARAAILELSEVIQTHLAHEERELEPLVAANQKTAPMKAANKQVRKASKGSAGIFFAWLLDGADADATAAIRKDVPPPVLFILARVGGRDYHKDIAPVWA